MRRCGSSASRKRPSSPWCNSICIRAAMHPGWLRCSSLKYSRYSRSSRLARRAHRRSRCDDGVAPRTVNVPAAPLARILVIEDNEDLAFGLRNNLEIEGYGVELAADGACGLSRARELQPDLIVLDLMLPELDGYRVLRQLREEGLDMPVVILTARTEEADKVRGFRLGADDY